LVKSNMWPTIVPLPVDLEARKRMLLSIFSSPITLEVLETIPIDKEILQRDLINRLSSHSNRTVIKSLKILKKYGLIREKDVVVKSGMRKVKVKSYMLTDMGKWFHFMFVDPKSMEPSTLRKMVEEFMELTINKISSLYSVDEMPHLSEMFLEKVIKSYMNYNAPDPQVYVLGSVAIDHYFKPISDAESLLGFNYEYIGSFPGGSGANVACNLSRFGLNVGFYGKIASDAHGLELFLDLVKNNVNLKHVVIDKNSKTVEVLVMLSRDGESKMTYMIHKDSALSPLNIDGEVLEQIGGSEAVYIGEVFHEVSSQVIRFCKKVGVILIVYRPSIYALKYMTSEYLSLLRYSPILIINSRKVDILESKGISVPSTLFNLGVENIIITMDSKGAILFSKRYGKGIRFTAPRVSPIDTVGAGDMFSATLIYTLLNGMELIEAIRYAVAAASLSTQYIGARSKTPLVNEIEEKIGEVKVIS